MTVGEAVRQRIIQLCQERNMVDFFDSVIYQTEWINNGVCTLEL